MSLRVSGGGGGGGGEAAMVVTMGAVLAVTVTPRLEESDVGVAAVTVASTAVATAGRYLPVTESVHRGRWATSFAPSAQGMSACKSGASAARRYVLMVTSTMREPDEIESEMSLTVTAPAPASAVSMVTKFCLNVVCAVASKASTVVSTVTSVVISEPIVPAGMLEQSVVRAHDVQYTPTSTQSSSQLIGLLVVPAAALQPVAAIDVRHVEAALAVHVPEAVACRDSMQSFKSTK